jgi:nucleosome-remodeling factor 38 kDa subunit
MVSLTQSWSEIRKFNETVVFSSNFTTEGSPFLITGDQAEEFLSKASDGGDAEPLSSTIDKWHFVHLQ